MQRQPFDHINHDLEVAWKDVFYAPSPACIQKRLRERGSIARAHRKQRERNMAMYELFGGGKSITEKLNLRKKAFGDAETDSELIDNKDQSIVSNRDSKDGKLKSSTKGHTQSKQLKPTNEIDKGPFVAISNLGLLFEASRPQPYFGIRKPKTFDNATEKEHRDDFNKPHVTINSIFELFVPYTFDASTRDFNKRHSSIASLSINVTSFEASEIRERFHDIAKGTKGGSIHGEVMEILNKIKIENMLNKQRMENLAGFYRITYPDIDDRIDRSRLLTLYVNKYYRANHPKHEDIMKEVNETEYENTIMKNCILNNQMILRILKNHSFYPLKFRTLLAEIDFKLASNDDHSEKNANKKMMPVGSETIQSGPKNHGSILDDMCQSCKEFNGFYRPLFEFWCSKMIDGGFYYGDIEASDVKHVVQSLTKLISTYKNIPGSRVLVLVQQLLRNGVTNAPLSVELCNNVEGWLDQILKTLVSKYATNRLECFITICYMISKPNYISGINTNFFNETFYDLVSSILRCMDLKPEEFTLYYSLLGVLFHYAPSQVLLDCLMERAPYLSNSEMVSKWPQFVYFAVKHWPSESFNASPIYLQRCIEKLESHYLREILSRKYLKDAITCISKRFNIKSDMFTVWPRFSEHFPD